MDYAQMLYEMYGECIERNWKLVARSFGVGLLLYSEHKYFESALGTFGNIMKSMENKLKFWREVAEVFNHHFNYHIMMIVIKYC
jgi:hypothetical protein